jgi:hypothetical protein
MVFKYLYLIYILLAFMHDLNNNVLHYAFMSNYLYFITLIHLMKFLKIMNSNFKKSHQISLFLLMLILKQDFLDL